MDQEAFRRLVRRKLQDGRLPHDGPRRVCGPSDGETCDACGTVLAKDQLLMEGIRKHKIDFVITVHRANSYYLPSDEDCFATLLKAYPEAFRLVDQAPEFKIFQVVTKDASPD